MLRRKLKEGRIFWCAEVHRSFTIIKWVVGKGLTEKVYLRKDLRKVRK